MSPATAASSSSLGTRRNSALPICASGAEAAAHEDVVGLDALAVGVARRRALEAEIGDPVLRAGVRAAVELQAERADRVAEALLEVLDQPAEALLRLGHREVAVRLAGAADRAAAHVVDVEREADRPELGDDLRARARPARSRR